MPLRLYNAQLSPYAARCRMAAYAKGLEIELAEMPGAISPEDFVKLNPMKKIPTLVDGEKLIPESQIICEYLETLSPDPALVPVREEEKWKAALLSRITDLYVLTPLGQLFGQINPQARDQVKCDVWLEDLKRGVEWLAHYLDGTPYAVGERLTLADCALLPVLFYIDKMGPLFGRPDFFQEAQSAKSYMEATREDPAAVRVLTEMEKALAERMG